MIKDINRTINSTAACIMRDFFSGPNHLTRFFMEYGKKGKYVYELCENGCGGVYLLYGLTVLKHVEDTTWEYCKKLSNCFQTLSEARKAIADLTERSIRKD